MEEILKIRWEERKKEYLRFGLVAATIVNVNRRKGTPLVQPGDFFRERPKEEDYMEVAEAEKELGMWAASLNQDMPPRVEGLEGNTL